jgi:hypothetical protein
MEPVKYANCYESFLMGTEEGRELAEKIGNGRIKYQTYLDQSKAGVKAAHDNGTCKGPDHG